jgi:hypothetical protein
LGIFLGLFLAAELLLNPFLNLVVKPNLIEKVSDGRYQLSMGPLHYNLLTSTLSARDIFYTWNDSSSNSTDSSAIFVKESEVHGVSLFDLIFNSRLNILELRLFKPEFKIFTLNARSSGEEDNETNNDSLSGIYNSAYRMFPDRLKPFKINRVEIEDGAFKKSGKQKKIIYSIGSADAVIKDFSVRSLEKSDSLKLMFSEEVSFNLNDINMSFPKYKGEIYSLNFSSTDSILMVKSFSFQPLLPDSIFFKGDTYRNDRWKIKIDELKCEGADLPKYIWDKIIEIREVGLNSQYIDILTNMRLDIPPDFDPEMPNEIVQRLPFYLNIRNLSLNIDSIIIREFWPHSLEPSRLPFTNVKGNLYNISTLEKYQTAEDPMIINASALLTGAGFLQLKMKVPLMAQGTDFEYSGSLGSMPTDPLNNHLIISDLTEISSGKIDSVIFNAEAENGVVNAYTVPYYRDLTIKSINETTLESTGLIAAVESFLGNVIKVNNENLPGSETRKGTVIYRRKKTDVFLDVVWTSLKQALGKVVGF